MKKLIFFGAVAVLIVFAGCRRDDTGSLTFWTNNNCSPNPITVSVGGQTAQIFAYFPPPLSIQFCNARNCANFSLKAGNYNYTATDGDSSWSGNVTVSRGGCTLQELTCSAYTGNVTFWTPSNCSTKPITVTADSISHTITQNYTSTTAGCGDSGCANFSLSPGTHNFTATNGDTTWTGTVSVTRGNCTLQQLTFATGNVTFWVDSNATNTVVTIDSASANITVAYPNGINNTCGTAGCANFTLHPGTYSYTAVTSSNTGYTGSVTVTANNCTVLKLY